MYQYYEPTIATLRTITFVFFFLQKLNGFMWILEINSFNVGDGVGQVGMPDEDGGFTVRGLDAEKWEWEKKG